MDVINEGMNEEKRKTIAVLSPRPGERWNPKLAQNQEIRVPEKGWFAMDQTTGTETFYVVWSATPVQEIEKFKASSNVRKGVIIIEDAAMISELKEFLKKNSAKLEEKNNEVTNQTELKGRGEILVQKIPLRHQ